jgi:hypothetical protein
MFLQELFEEDDEDLKLSPGEKREIQVKLKDLKKIYNKITDTKMFLSNLEYQNTPSRSLAAKYEEFKQKVKNKIKEYKDRLETEKQKSQEENPELKQLIEKIRKNCSIYLQAVKDSGGKYIYRGHTKANPVFVARSIDNRQPKDSNKQEQKVFDAAMTLVGIKANRSNSIFATSSYEQASGYAAGSAPHIIFPINGFNYLYTREDDLIMRRGYMIEFCNDKKMEDYIQELTDFIQQTEYTEKTVKNLYYGTILKLPNSSDTGEVVSTPQEIGESGQVEVYTKNGYKVFTLDDMIKSNPEKNISITTTSKKYSDYMSINNHDVRNIIEFILNKNYSATNKINDIVRKINDPNIIPGIPENLKFTESRYISFLDKEKITSKLRPQDSNLDSYLKNRTGEICINGSYYALNYDDFKDIINKEFTPISRY